MEEVEVIISGGGSVGLSLAAELGWRGIKCMLVEKVSFKQISSMSIE